MARAQRWICVLASCALANAAHATDLSINETTFELPESGLATVDCTIGWANAWRNQKNHDAAWVFVKFRAVNQTWWAHAALDSIEAEGDIATSIQLPMDRVGAFVAPGETHRGDVEWSLNLTLDESATAFMRRLEERGELEVRVFALEMVHIPGGAFTLGEPSADARAHASFFESNSQGEPAGLWRIESEGSIPVGPREGHLYYDLSERMAQYEGDQGGPIPESFPKGFAAFYTMKYEVTQGQYASFLNTIGDSPSAMRDNRGGRAILAPDSRATIRLESSGEYVASAPNRPANYISWDDGCAFADWAGLRPMTELEFTKACRGPEEPADHQFPWGTDNKDRLSRVMGEDFDLVGTGASVERTLSDDTRDVHGASYYWVMDLAGSVWERCVTIGHPIGRAFEGTHGDGRLNGQGFATNDDWPRGDGEVGGYGYRGGGHYEVDHEYSERSFNPHSPIAWRRFGSWAGGPRYIAYGFRAVRTAP